MKFLFIFNLKDQQSPFSKINGISEKLISFSVNKSIIKISQSNIKLENKNDDTHINKNTNAQNGNFNKADCIEVKVLEKNICQGQSSKDVSHFSYNDDEGLPIIKAKAVQKEDKNSPLSSSGSNLNLFANKFKASEALEQLLGKKRLFGKINQEDIDKSFQSTCKNKFKIL